MSSPFTPMALLSISSVREEQSQPQPYSLKMSIKNGLGVAFTAKNSLYPLFQENASFKAFALALIPKFIVLKQPEIKYSFFRHFQSQILLFSPLAAFSSFVIHFQSANQ